ncbi:TrkH family potassium uptake protein [Hyphomonas sp.]|uniref:TrkH family potassium uptake protein n=1 Tax=Hyphomonas sp. TaxID=87 RepID=UPI00391DD013
MQLRPVIYALGMMILLVTAAMVPCALIDIADATDQQHVFVTSGAISLLVGSLLFVLARSKDLHIGQREAFLLTVSIWVVINAVGALPFLVSGYSITDSFFESVSGMTTTGATILTGLDSMPRGLLLWRSILHWIGGVGIIVTAVAILPQLRVGGMQLFNLESSDRTGKFLPKVSDIAAYIGFAYVALTAMCALLYGLTGMNWFDAINHAMSTLSAGGFSTYDASFGQFNGTGALYVAIVFMALAAMPFSLFAILLLNGRPGPLLRDPQPRLLLAIAITVSAIIILLREAQFQDISFSERWDEGVAAVFNVISVLTGTGFATAPYDTWGEPIAALFLFITFLGGCAGSAAGGIKMFRLEITWKALIAWGQRMVQPHRKAPIWYGGRIVDDDTLQSVMVFLFLYLMTFMVSAALLSFGGLDTISAITAAAACISNVGPGLGPIVGPSTNYGVLSDFATWVCTVTMLLGRLEFLVVFVVLTPRFWRG